MPVIKKHNHKYKHSCLLTTRKDFEHFAETVALNSVSGDVIALDGSLGVGKTTFVQAYCQALGVSELVTSPTFSLINVYLSGKKPILHCDVYRLENNANQLESELNDYFMHYPDSILLVEWAAYAPFLISWVTATVLLRFAEASDSSDDLISTARCAEVLSDRLIFGD
ncbi:MAG: tRNA (adenosine(37)-N6)-threonylcarbamoyltransferase complex ATPase subunit type 1 TsaE [Cyanobacteria bacterium P01_H01_bin.74]